MPHDYATIQAAAEERAEAAANWADEAEIWSMRLLHGRSRIEITGGSGHSDSECRRIVEALKDGADVVIRHTAPG